MTVFHWHEDRFRDPTIVKLRSLAHRVICRIGAVAGVIHRTIVAAKLLRVQRELRLRDIAHGGWPPERNNDAAKFPQRPMILGDKWDF